MHMILGLWPWCQWLWSIFSRPVVEVRVVAGTVIPDRLLTTAEVAKRLGCSTETVLNYAKAGRIPCVRINRNSIRFNWEKVVEALERGEAVPS